MIGERLPRIEDERLLTGGGRFVGDIKLPGMLSAAFVRCPHGHARVQHIDLKQASSMPGVVSILTPDSLPELRSPIPVVFPSEGLSVRMPLPLATEVRFAGEAVAVVLADDPYRAVDAAATIHVEYELLPVVEDVEQALEGGVRVHDDLESNLVGSVTNSYGAAADILGHAGHVTKRRLRAERSACAAMEPRAVVVDPTPNGLTRLTVYDATQAPHSIRRGLANVLGLPPEAVRVVAPDVGGGFGPKGRLYPEEIVLAAAALHIGRPVSWQGTRAEDLAATYQGRGAVFDCELAADRDGRLMALRARITQDVGAYAATSIMVPLNSAQHLLGPYHLPAVEIEVRGVYTNKVPLTPLRGGGRELGVWAMERMLDHLAGEIGMDPLELRARNVLQPEEFPYDTGYPSRSGGALTYDSGDYPGCLRRCRELTGYDAVREQQAAERRTGRFRGVGVTLFLESTGMAGETARATLLQNGRVWLRIGSPSTGQGHATTMAQMFSERFGLRVDRVDYLSGDTEAVDEGIGTFGSRMAVIAGNAAARAGRELRSKVLALAAEKMEASIEDMELVEGRVQVKGVPARAMELARLAGEAHEPVEVDAVYVAERGSAFAGGAHGAVVEVDVETGQVTLERYVVVHDCGTVINPMLVEGQIHGGVVHGLGNVLKEACVYSEAGELRSATFGQYGLVLASEAPRIEIEHRESPTPYNPEGIKGAGEGGTIGALATVARAIENALEPLNVEVNTLPMTPETLWRACEPLRNKPMPAGAVSTHDDAS